MAAKKAKTAKVTSKDDGAKVGTDAGTIAKVARAICGNSLTGYCAMVGGDVDGCKVGRGESYNGTNCKARIEALQLGMEWRQAIAAVAGAQQQGPPECICPKCGLRHGTVRIDGDSPF